MRKFTLKYHTIFNGNRIDSTEDIDYSGVNAKKLEDGQSYFANWMHQLGVEIPRDERSCGRVLLDFFNDTLRPGELERIYDGVTIEGEND